MQIVCNRMPIPPLPVELTDEIIAWIPTVCSGKGKTTTLLRCSLVCSAWVPRSRHHLFDDCSVGLEKYDVLLSRALRSSRLRPYLTSVRTLEIYDDGTGYELGSSQSDSTPRWRWGLIHELAGHLPNLVALKLKSNFIAHPVSTSMVISRFSSVRLLHFNYCLFDSFGTLRRILTALPSLKELHMHGVTDWPSPHDALSPPLLVVAKTSRPALDHLYINWHSGHITLLQQFLSWLSATSTVLSLRDFHLATSTFHCRFVTKVLSRCTPLGQAVRTLRIQVDGTCEGQWVTVSPWFMVSVIDMQADRLLYRLGISNATVHKS